MIEKILTDEGFKPAGTCHCNMTLNLKFSKGPWLIYYMPKRRQFHVKKDGRKVKGLTDIKHLQKYVTEETQDTPANSPASDLPANA